MMRAWVFDVDGTLSNSDHRAHHLRQEPKDWEAFYSACPLDPPHEHITHLARVLTRSGVVLFITGREERHRVPTETWLHENGLWPGDAQAPRLFMRPTGDHRPDYVVKPELLGLAKTAGFEPIMIFEDRSSVVNAWRAAGIPCAQVAPGDF